MKQGKGTGAADSNARVFELIDASAITKMRGAGTSRGLRNDEVNWGRMESVLEKIFCVCPTRLGYLRAETQSHSALKSVSPPWQNVGAWKMVCVNGQLWERDLVGLTFLLPTLLV